jgi:hypothetical protein
VPPLIDLGAEHLCACHFRQPEGVAIPEAVGSVPEAGRPS